MFTQRIERVDRKPHSIAALVAGGLAGETPHMISASMEKEERNNQGPLHSISRWKHSQIFSNFGDGDSENSDDDYMDAKRNSGWHSKYSSDFQSQASSLRSRRTRKAAQSLQEDLFD
ncbi:putative RRP12-like protein [Forsythia ovata]|uniref:RRP12-like protein n=1 Tax=Forsythia ovata TaxID=205694 RepID=A0ABD1SLA1_9LAMI